MEIFIKWIFILNALELGSDGFSQKQTWDRDMEQEVNKPCGEVTQKEEKPVHHTRINRALL